MEELENILALVSKSFKSTFLTASSPTQSKELLFWLVDLLPTTSHLPNLKHITSCYVIQVLYDMN